MAVVHTDGPVVEERHHVVHDTDSSSSSTMAIAVLLIVLLVVGFFLVASGAFPLGANRSSTIDVDLPNVTTPDITPDVNVNNENNLPNTAE
jgi:hypothetical protein